MWRKRIMVIAALMGCTLLVAGLSFTAGIYTAAYPRSAIASRLPLAHSVVGAVETNPTLNPPEDVEEEFQVFWDVWRIIEKDFFGTAERQAMIQGAIKGMVEALGDPYTQYINPEHNAIMREDDQGGFEGIGATVDMVDDRLTVIAPLKNSPAERAGLKAGDVILEVDGRPVTGLDLLEAVSLVRGPKNSTVTLTIERKGMAAPFKVSIVRDAIALLTVESRMLTDQVGYLAIHGFSARTVDELDDNLRELEELGTSSLILDLRGNPGGYLDAAVETVSRFIDSGPVLWWESAEGTRYAIRVKPRQTYRWPMVVLVDEGSASAAEIVAGALQDTARATLVGVRTFGKGSVQNVHQLRDGGSVRVTTAHWLTPLKHEIHGVGLEPDIHVANDDSRPDYDAQLNFARRWLQQRGVAVPDHIPFE